MKKKELNRLLAQLRAQQQQMLNRATAQSPWEKEVENEYRANKTFLDSKDYRNLPDGVNIPMLSLADSQKMRQMTRGQNLGQSASGVNPQMLAAQRELSDNQFAEDWGGEYEAKVGGLMDQNQNRLSFLQGAHGNRMNAGLQGGSNMLGQAMQITPEKGFWSSFLPGLLQGGASAALSFL
jgi:hypothetical protein